MIRESADDGEVRGFVGSEHFAKAGKCGGGVGVGNGVDDGEGIEHPVVAYESFDVVGGDVFFVACIHREFVDFAADSARSIADEFDEELCGGG